jgi:hypothetical protein
MHFVPCTRPAGPLEEAPAPSLRLEGEGERLDGFWCDADESYYARVSGTEAVETGGAERWYRIVDESEASGDSAKVIPLPVRRDREPRRPALLLLGKLRAGGSPAAPVLLGATRPRR